MLNKRILAISITILAFAGLVLADAAPEPGYVRVANPLIIEPQEDFADYRFFLNSPGDFEEIKLTKGKTTTISSDGRGGSMRFTTLIAIPVESMLGYDDPGNPEKSQSLREGVNAKKVDGMIELASHVFDAYVKKREAKAYKATKYVLKASEEKKIEAVEVKQTPSKKTKGEVEGDSGNSHLAANIAAGSLLSLSFIFGGVWFARRKRDVSAAQA